MKNNKVFKLFRSKITWLIALCLLVSLLFPTASINSTAATTADEKTNTSTIYYLIKRGDTLSKIAAKYNTTVSKLKQLNNLKSNLIISGRKLIVSMKIIPNDYTVTASNPI